MSTTVGNYDYRLESPEMGINDEIPIEGGLRRAILKYAPRRDAVEKCRVAKIAAVWRRTVVNVQDEVLIIYGENVKEEEVDTMEFVATNTTIPVARVYGVHKEDEITYIVTEFINGDTLAHAWDLMDHNCKQDVANQLRIFFAELHGITGSYIGSLGRKPCHHSMVRGPSFGPFDREEQLTEALLRRKPIWEPPSETYVTFMLKAARNDHKIVFSHNAILKENIIVVGSKVVEIRGWHSSGFYPEYWDFTRATFGDTWDSDWIVYVLQFLDPFYEEVAFWFREWISVFG